MRLALDPRARRLLRRVPRTTVYSAAELALLSLLAMQCARLVWTVVTPVGPVGDWKTSAALRPALSSSTSLLSSFDPFFRVDAQGAAPVVVTSLNLKLFGVREDRASGRGSAIIALPEGQQRSFAVGEEIVPGVTLTAVGFDNVTISRGGTAEQLFLDQSSPAGTGTPQGVISAPPPSVNFGTPPAPPPVVSTTPAPPMPAPPTGNSITSDIQFQPRINNGQLSGVAVQPQGSGNAFRAAGFAPGDVITSVNGQRITSAEQARALAAEIGNGEASVVVNRAGRTVPLQVRVGR
jgi:general secretion pathway protein C